MITPRLSALTALFLVGLAFGLGLINAMPNQLSPPPKMSPYASPLAVALCPDHRHAVVALSAANSIALVDLAAGRVLQELPTGRQPVAIAVSSDGKSLAVACRGDDQIHQVAMAPTNEGHPPSLRTIGKFDCGHLPADLVFSPSSERLFVACSGSHEIAVVELSIKKPHISCRWPAWQEPRKLILAPDGSTLYVGCSRGATVRAMQTATGKELWSRPMEAAFNMLGLALDSKAGELITCQVFHRHHAIAKSNIEQGWALDNRLGRILLSEPTNDPWQVALDVRGKAVGDPAAVAVDPSGFWLALAAGGTQEVLVFQRKAMSWSHGDPGDFLDSALEYPSRKYERVQVGGRPVALIFLPGGRELLVVNHLGDSLQVISTESSTVTRTIRLRPEDSTAEAESALVRQGEALFYNALKSHHHWFSCNTCHTDGHTCGQPFDTLNDDSYGNPKQTPTLLGVGTTAPFTWHGWKDSLEKTVQDSLVNTLFGAEPSPLEVKSLTAYLLSLKPIPNPHRPIQGTSWSKQVERGRVLFYGKANCVRCHAGETFTTPRNHILPVEADGSPFETWNPPSLRGVYDRAPLMHHGLATDLTDLLHTYHRPEKMGGSPLEKDEVSDLIAFLKTL